ncbi:hypothetical protein GFM07_38500 [Rhizobium leguminosarum bv. viciae]|nr:hypothetical protein [Rhizobium leguminosarum bv. viciae]
MGKGAEKFAVTLRLLFASENAPQSKHYFAGYLWVKAAAAKIAAVEPRMARPPVMLPFLIRLLCDHPIIEKIWRMEADEEEVAMALRGTVNRLDRAALERVMKALADPEHLATFDLWNLHSFLEDPDKMTPGSQTDEIVRAFSGGRDASELEFRIRASASIHFPSRTTGTLKKVEIEDGSLSFEIEIGGSEDQQIVSGSLLSISRLWSMYGRSPAQAKLVERHIGNAYHLEQLVWDRLRQLVGQEITIAQYWALTSPVIFGIVIWHGEEMMQIPLEPSWFEYRDLIRISQTGLGISIAERRRFAQELEPADDAVRLGHKMTARLMSDLVSDVPARDRLLERRFPGVLQTEEERKALEDWVSCALFRQDVWQLGRPAADRLSSCFDLPGFPGVTFDDLLPFITPDYQWKRV